MTDSTRRIQTDGLMLERVAFFRRVLQRAQDDGTKLDVHVLATGQLSLLKAPKIEAVDDASVTLFGTAVIPVAPNQAIQETGRFFVPLLDVVRVFYPTGITLAGPGTNPR